LFVVDDSPSGVDPRILAAFSGDDRLRYVRNETNLGMVGNWNRCVELATHDYLAILHDDDLWEPDYVRQAVDVLDRHKPAGLLCTATTHIDGDDRQLGISRPWPDDRILSGEQVFRELIFGNKIYCPSIMVRRHCYDVAGRFDAAVRHAADWEMWLRICLRFDVAYVATPLARYREHQQRTTNALAEGDDAILQRDACGVVARGGQAAADLGRMDLARVARRSLAQHAFELGYQRRYRGDVALMWRQIREAWSADPLYVLARPHRVLKMLAYSIITRLAGRGA